MTDDDLKDIIRDYILEGVVCDAGDCLHERDEFEQLEDGEWDEIAPRLYKLYGKAVVEVSFDD